MTDLSQTIAPKSDQLNADDLIAGPKTITVTRVQGQENADQPVSIFFEGDNGKPYKPCLSMRRVMVQVWGPDGAKYPGRSMTLYNDPEVKFGGIKVGGIRISHMSNIERAQSLMLTTTRARRNEYVVKPLAANQNEEVLLRAREQADKGKDAFTEFWNSPEGKRHRDLLRPHMEDLKKRAQEADEASQNLAQRLQQQNEAAEPPEQEPGQPIDGEILPAEEESQDEPLIDPSELEFAEGVTAANEEKTAADCPYDDIMKRAHWLAGFKQQSNLNAEAEG